MAYTILRGIIDTGGGWIFSSGLSLGIRRCRRVWGNAGHASKLVIQSGCFAAAEGLIVHGLPTGRDEQSVYPGCAVSEHFKAYKLANAASNSSQSDKRELLAK